MPNELLLMIASFLDKEFQVLLSISCRRLRVLLNGSLDLSLPDLRVKLRFLRYLEIDYPEYWPCRSCGFTFKWQFSLRTDYRCPGRRCHSPDTLPSYAWFMEGDRKILMSREVVDLIFRGHERGQRYGLPLSCFRKSGSCYRGVTQANEARLIDGQLLLASRLETYSDSREDMEYKVGSFHRALCSHSPRNKIWQIVQQAFGGMTALEKPRVSKCPFCAMDYEVYAQTITAE